MARIRQFAKDMGLSYNKAKSLVNKGRKLKDGGSSVLESTMNKAKNGKFTKAKVKKEKLDSVIKGKEPPHGSKVPEFMKKYYKEAAKQKKEAKQPGYKKGGATEFGMLSVKAGIDNNPKPTQADRIAGATKGKKMMRGGPVRKRQAMPRPAKSERNLNQPKEMVTPFKGVLKTSEGEKLKNIDGKTFLVKPNPAYKPKPPKSAMRGKKMKMGGSNEKNEKSKKQDSPLKGDRKEEFIGRLPNKRKEEFIGRLPNKRKEGGGFPDLSGDGKVTKKDVLIGRGVIKKSRGGGLAIQGTQFRGVR
tara:strand:+ start:611 stop:1516 length:906 start_codon:yes stop_codon:yes gene_type:complete